MRYYLFTFLLGIGLFFTSCEEAPIPITLEPLTGDKTIVLEEYSGASCVPCVEGHQILENLEHLYGENLIVVTMHTFVGGQGNPLPESNYDFRTQGGQDILEYLGFPQGIPSGVVDRSEFTGGDGLQLSKQQWAGAISEEVQKQARLLMDVSTEYNPTSREVSIDVSMLPLEDINESTSLTVLITESKIHDWQATPDGHVEDYEHNNILRAVISPTLGAATGALTKNESKTMSFDFTLPVANETGPWNSENCKIIAYVSINDLAGGNKEVLQGAVANVE